MNKKLAGIFAMYALLLTGCQGAKESSKEITPPDTGWGKTVDETSTPFNNMMELYFEEFDIDGLLAKYESGKYSVRYVTKLTELAGGQKLVRLYDPSGNLIEVRTPFMSN